MPIYSYKCSGCGRESDEFRSINERLQVRRCGCGGDLCFILSAKPKGRDLYPFVDDCMDHRPVVIHSLKHYRRELANRGLIERGKRRGHKGQWV